MEALQQVRVVPQNDGDVKVKLIKEKIRVREPIA